MPVQQKMERSFLKNILVLHFTFTTLHYGSKLHLNILVLHFTFTTLHSRREITLHSVRSAASYAHNQHVVHLFELPFPLIKIGFQNLLLLVGGVC